MLTIGIRSPSENGGVDSDDLHSSPSPLISASRLASGKDGGTSSQLSLIRTGIDGSPAVGLTLVSVAFGASSSFAQFYSFIILSF